MHSKVLEKTREVNGKQLLRVSGFIKTAAVGASLRLGFKSPEEVLGITI